jgi:hypothetical protein
MLSVAVLIMALTVGTTVGGWAIRDEPAYEANAVIAPLWLNMSTVRVPRTVSSLVESSSSVLARGEGLVVTPIEDTGLTLVSYRSDDPEIARAEANRHVDQIVDDLNERSFGLGRFVRLAPAEPQPRSKPGPLNALIMGVVAGLCFVVCAYGVTLAWSALPRGDERVAKLELMAASP